MIYDLRSAFGGAYGQHTKCYAKFQKVDDRTTHAVLVVWEVTAPYHRYHPPNVVWEVVRCRLDCSTSETSKTSKTSKRIATIVEIDGVEVFFGEAEGQTYRLRRCSPLDLWNLPNHMLAALLPLDHDFVRVSPYVNDDRCALAGLWDKAAAFVLYEERIAELHDALGCPDLPLDVVRKIHDTDTSPPGALDVKVVIPRLARMFSPFEVMMPQTKFPDRPLVLVANDRSAESVKVVIYVSRYYDFVKVRLFPMGSSSVLDLSATMSATTSPGPVKLFDFASVAPSSDESCKD